MSTEQRTTSAIVADRYEILHVLGRGSFGRTYLARDREAGRLVAIKHLDFAAATDWKGIERFEREAAVLGSLRHHGIPEVYALLQDRWDGAAATFLVMEYVEGVSLAQVIEERRQLDPADVVSIFLEQLGILEYLHTRVPPVLHRDIKPANIILRPNGLPALVDFGSVRRVFKSPDESGSTIAGTYGYMPYEQYMGQASPASDLYALGATFLHLVTGRPPRDFMTAEGRIEVPATLPGDGRMQAILARLLRASPAERFQSARDTRQALLTTPTVALVGRADHAAVARRPAPAIAELPPAPRAIEGRTKALLDAACPSTLQLMDSTAKPGDKPSLLDWGALVFFSALTAGILPLVFLTMARSRRRRLQRFFHAGLPALAEVIDIQTEKTAFDATIARVSYQFEADGQLHRDTDRVLAGIAGRWQPGDRVEVLYMPDYAYDSVIISSW